MPAPAALISTPKLPELFLAYLNATTRKGPFRNLYQESVDSGGHVLVDLIELFTGRPVQVAKAGETLDGLLAAYKSILLFLQRHGALVATVLPEHMLTRVQAMALLEQRETRRNAARECALWCACGDWSCAA